jgi:citronellol/citronellal dehydrogenase
MQRDRPTRARPGSHPRHARGGGGWIVTLTSAGARLHQGPPFYLGPQDSTMELYGTTKAALHRITSGLAGDLDGTGIRVNAMGPRVAVISEGFEAIIGDQLPRELFESIEEIVDWGLTVRSLDGLAQVRQHHPQRIL